MTVNRRTTRAEHVYRVSFKEPLPEVCEGKTDFFFTSLAAIYDQFNKRDIGCQVSRLWNLKITPDSPYRGRRCVITKEPVARKRRTLKK